MHRNRMYRKRYKGQQPFLFVLYKYIIIVIIVVLVLRYIIMNSSVYYRQNIMLPFSFHLTKQDLYMIKGEEYKLGAFVINKRLTYSSTNFRVVGVNFNGRLYAYNTGKAFIIVKSGNKERKCRVHVIDISKDKITLKKGRHYDLDIEGTTAFIRWKSSNKSVATVSMFGNVKGVKQGTAVISGKVKGKTVRCTVVVK